MRKIILLLAVFCSLLSSCKKQSLPSQEIAPLLAQNVEAPTSLLSTATTITTFNNESSIDGDKLTNPRLISALPASLNRTLWGTYDSDFQAFNATAGVTYTVTVSNYNVNNDQVPRFRLEVYKGSGTNFTFLYRGPDGQFTTTFTATESIQYIIAAGDQNSDLNTGRSLGDYTITVNAGTSGGPVQTTVQLAGVSVSPGTVKGGTTANGTVSLSAAAPAGGVTVALSSNNTLARVPATVVVPAGSTSSQFSINTSTTRRNATASIVANYNGVSRSANLTVTK
jgi:hypothetical protein